MRNLADFAMSWVEFTTLATDVRVTPNPAFIGMTNSGNGEILDIELFRGLP